MPKLKSLALLVLIYCCTMLPMYALAPEDSCQHSLQGTVHVQGSPDKASFAYLQLVELGKISTANEQGLFSFEELCPGTYTLVCNFVNCQKYTATVHIPEDTRFHVHLLPSNEVLEEVKIEETQDQSTEQSAVIREEAFQALAGNSFADIASELPGTYTIQTGATLAKPVVQGLSGMRVLLYTNGVRLESQQWGQEHAPEIDPFSSSSMRLIKGGNSVRYGSDAIGGILLAESKELPTCQKLSGIWLNSFQSNARAISQSLQLEGGISFLKNFSWRVQGSSKMAGNYRTPSYWVDNSGLKEANFSFAASYTLKKLKIKTYYSQFNTQIGVFKGSHIGNLTDLNNALQRNEPLGADTVSFSYRIANPQQKIAHELSSLSASYRLGEKSSLELLISRQYNLRREYDAHKPKNDSLAKLNLPSLKLGITTHAADLCLVQQLGNQVFMNIGLAYTAQENTYDGRYFIPNFTSKQLGAYGSVEILGKKAEAQIGLRRDHKKLDSYLWRLGELDIVKHRFAGWAASAGYSRELTEHSSIQASAGLHWRAPHVSELWSDGLHHGVGAIEKGNSQLKEERALQSSLSFTHKTDKAHYWFSAYANRIEDYIYLNPTQELLLTVRGAFPLYRYESKDVLFIGTDVELERKLTKLLNISWKTSFVKANCLGDPNTKLPFIPPLRSKIGISILLPDAANRTNSKLELNSKFVARQYEYAKSDFAEPPKAYFLLGAKASTDFILFKHKASLSLIGENLLNQRYRDYMNRLRYFLEEPGINLQFVLRYTFGNPC